jgi:hypothetical protein
VEISQNFVGFSEYMNFNDFNVEALFLVKLFDKVDAGNELKWVQRVHEPA